jgi:hypothetical protein
MRASKQLIGTLARRIGIDASRIEDQAEWDLLECLVLESRVVSDADLAELEKIAGRCRPLIS